MSQKKFQTTKNDYLHLPTLISLEECFRQMHLSYFCQGAGYQLYILFYLKMSTNIN